MLWGHGNPRSPLQSSHLLCSDEQAGRKAPRSLGTGSWTSKQNQQATSPTQGRSPQSTRFWKVAKSHHWGFTWLNEAPPALAPEIPINAHGSLWSHRLGKEGKSALSALQRLLCCSVTASPGASARSPRTGTQDPSPAVKTPLHDLLWPSGPPHLSPTKAARLWLPHSQQGHPDLAQGSGREEIFLVSDAGGDTTIGERDTGRRCLFRRTSESAANAGVPGTAVI